MAELKTQNKLAMQKQYERYSIMGFPVVVLIGVLLAAAGSQGGALWRGFPIFAMCVAFAFLIQWLAVIPFWMIRTEKYFDLMGAVTHISVVLMAYILSPKSDVRSTILVLLIGLWAFRLGSFLFLRVVKAGADDRWDDLKQSFPRFFIVWTLQGIWVSFTQAAALAAITSTVTAPIGILFGVGLVVWLVGFLIEVLADQQKTRFRNDPANAEHFISTGLWAYSRHPNYFGEIVLWVGIAIMAWPALSGWQYVTLISPVFVYILLTRISGIPLLEAKANTKWGGQAEYEAYKASTPELFPRL